MLDAFVNINWPSFLAPILWLVSLVIEFGIYSLILYIAMCIMKIPCKKVMMFRRMMFMAIIDWLLGCNEYVAAKYCICR